MRSPPASPTCACAAVDFGLTALLLLPGPTAAEFPSLVFPESVRLNNREPVGNCSRILAVLGRLTPTPQGFPAPNPISPWETSIPRLVRWGFLAGGCRARLLTPRARTKQWSRVRARNLQLHFPATAESVWTWDSLPADCIDREW